MGFGSMFDSKALLKDHAVLSLEQDQLQGHVTCAYKGPMLDLMLYCCCLDILNSFLTRDLYFHFPLVPTNMELVLPKGISTTF